MLFGIDPDDYEVRYPHLPVVPRCGYDLYGVNTPEGSGKNQGIIAMNSGGFPLV
jgi:hypothetical protein